MEANCLLPLEAFCLHVWNFLKKKKLDIFTTKKHQFLLVNQIFGTYLRVRISTNQFPFTETYAAGL